MRTFLFISIVGNKYICIDVLMSKTKDKEKIDFLNKLFLLVTLSKIMEKRALEIC